MLTLLVGAATMPPECESPELHDVLKLKQLAQLDGALSVGLDSVATWCFDPGGNWTGGIPPSPMKGKQKNPDAQPTGDCAKAIASCSASFKATLDHLELRDLAARAMTDLDRPFRSERYAPKRVGLKDKPDSRADCHSRERSELFAQAQSRMDLARLTSQVQSEYANYKAWLLQQPMPEKWKYLAEQTAKQETDRDYTLGFLASREIRGCDCTRVNPAAIVRSLEKKEGSASLLEAEDGANTRCAVCALDAYVAW